LKWVEAPTPRTCSTSRAPRGSHGGWIRGARSGRAAWTERPAHCFTAALGECQMATPQRPRVWRETGRAPRCPRPGRAA
jgi:hypothetical protein